MKKAHSISRSKSSVHHWTRGFDGPIAIAVIVVLALIVFFVFRAPASAPAPATTTLPAVTTTYSAPTTLAPSLTTTRPTTTTTLAPAVARAGIYDFYYSPANITISTGTTVVWHNYGGVLHTVTSDDHTLNSPSMGTGMEYNHTFSAAGTVKYYDSLHAGPVGWVIVTG